MTDIERAELTYTTRRLVNAIAWRTKQRTQDEERTAARRAKQRERCAWHVSGEATR